MKNNRLFLKGCIFIKQGFHGNVVGALNGLVTSQVVKVFNCVHSESAHESIENGIVIENEKHTIKGN